MPDSSEAPDGLITADEKLKHTHRLIREGRWADFKRTCDDIRQRKRAGCMERAQAVHEAWMETLELFPPLPPKLAPEPNDDDEEAIVAKDAFERFLGQSIDIKADVLEAYQRLPQPGLIAEDFERGGAWLLYDLARKDVAKRQVFVHTVAVKYLDQAQKAEEAAGAEGGSDKLLKLIDTLQAEMEKGKARTVKCQDCGAEVPCPVRYGGDPEPSVLEATA